MYNSDRRAPDKKWKLIGDAIKQYQQCSDVNTLSGSVPEVILSVREIHLMRLALAWVKEENKSEDDVETCDMC